MDLNWKYFCCGSFVNLILKLVLGECCGNCLKLMLFLPLNRKEDLGLDMNQLKEMVLERPWFGHQPTCSNNVGFYFITVVGTSIFETRLAVYMQVALHLNIIQACMQTIRKCPERLSVCYYNGLESLENDSFLVFPVLSVYLYTITYFTFMCKNYFGQSNFET
jgi:hypothetical protein